jgi:tungstate transport system ATP-binding protein
MSALPSSPPAALLSLHALKKSFGERRLLDLANVTFTPGKLFVLTGDNGSGKTTFLRILSGIERADQLAMTFDGAMCESASAYPAAWRRHIIYVHQHPYLFHSSIADNIAYGLKMRGMNAATRAPIIDAAIAWAGLQARTNVPPKRLSGGERQKVALARAKVLHPQVLLVDEPTANLDRDARLQIAALLKAFVDDGRIVIVASHDHEIVQLPGAMRLHLEDAKLSRGAQVKA